uniref:Uncharacterized protein n=1 Tax=Rhizophora mucronata TaxID=61149 RepID=A0A2P2NAY2_RHIMU
MTIDVAREIFPKHFLDNKRALSSTLPTLLSLRACADTNYFLVK